MQSAALRVAVAPAPAALATRASLRMAMPTIEDARTLSDAEIRAPSASTSQETTAAAATAKSSATVHSHTLGNG